MRPRGESAAVADAAVADAAVIEGSLRDPEQFAILFDRHAPRIHRYLARRVGRQVADDLLAETFLAALRGAGGSPAPIHVPGCRAGHQLRVQAPAAEGGAPGGQPCTPQPAYFPGMPASPPALRSYLERTRDLDPSSAWYLNDFGKTVDQLLSQAYLSSRQRAGLYDLMAQTPGFTLIPRVADGIGRPGVGIAWPAPGGRTMIIFNPDTYAELGVTTRGAGGATGTGALLKLAIVNRPGQLP